MAVGTRQIENLDWGVANIGRVFPFQSPLKSKKQRKVDIVLVTRSRRYVITGGGSDINMLEYTCTQASKSLHLKSSSPLDESQSKHVK